jgi:DNA-binding response OmpR family regulator
MAIRIHRLQAKQGTGCSVNASKRVLVVDDDQELAHTLETVLQNEGFEVFAVDRGEAAIAYCKDGKPDLIILDFELPDMTGQNVCRQLRTFTDAYVVMLTGRSSEIDKVVSLSIGADDYVTKPFSYGELVARVHAMLKRPRVIGDAALPDDRRAFGKLVLDTAARVVTVSGAEVDVTRTEYDLLEQLSSSPGMVLSRKDLLDRIWATPWTDSNHLIDVHVHNLRKKLHIAGCPKEVITTVRGVGFRLSTAGLDGESADG